MKLSIGEKIALLRKKKNITQTELAQYLVLAPQTISRWEVGSGAPDITLLPKIAAFFGVSIDELFGVVSIERAEDLVSKYSVLRDDRSFQEAMECVDSQIQTISASLRESPADTAALKAEKDQLKALKLHLWIQQGREAFQRALKITDSFVQETEKNPEHPWYLRMRLQRNQLLAALENGREALAACKKDFAQTPNAVTLQIYLSLLFNLQNYEEILFLQESDRMAGEIIFPPSKENVSIWYLLIRAAAETEETAFIEQYMPPVLDVCDKRDEFDFLMCLLNFYQKTGQEEKLTAVRQRLLVLLPEMSFSQYFDETIRKKIENSCSHVS